MRNSQLIELDQLDLLHIEGGRPLMSAFDFAYDVYEFAQGVCEGFVDGFNDTDNAFK